MAPGLRHPVMAISINTNPNLLQNLCILCRREFVCSFPKALSFTERKSTIGRGRYHSSLRCRSAGLSARVASIAFGDGSCVFAFGGLCVPSVLGRALPSFDSTSRAQPNPDTQPRNSHTQRVPHPRAPRCGCSVLCCVFCVWLHTPTARSDGLCPASLHVQPIRNQEKLRRYDYILRALSETTRCLETEEMYEHCSHTFMRAVRDRSPGGQTHVCIYSAPPGVTGLPVRRDLLLTRVRVRATTRTRCPRFDWIET